MSLNMGEIIFWTLFQKRSLKRMAEHNKKIKSLSMGTSLEIYIGHIKNILVNWRERTVDQILVLHGQTSFWTLSPKM